MLQCVVSSGTNADDAACNVTNRSLGHKMSERRSVSRETSSLHAIVSSQLSVLPFFSLSLRIPILSFMQS